MNVKKLKNMSVNMKRIENENKMKNMNVNIKKKF